MILKIFNFLLLQVGWFVCVLGPVRGYSWAGPLFVFLFLVAHVFFSKNRKQELVFIMLVGMLGTTIDTIKKDSGLLQYAPGTPDVAALAPTWIIALWLLLACTFRSSLGWLGKRYVLAALLGAVSGPLSYLAGARCGAIKFSHNIPISLVILALVWGIVLPTLAWLSLVIYPEPSSIQNPS